MRLRGFLVDSELERSVRLLALRARGGRDEDARRPSKRRPPVPISNARHSGLERYSAAQPKSLSHPPVDYL